MHSLLGILIVGFGEFMYQSASGLHILHPYLHARVEIGGNELLHVFVPNWHFGIEAEQDLGRSQLGGLMHRGVVGEHEWAQILLPAPGVLVRLIDG